MGVGGGRGVRRHKVHGSIAQGVARSASDDGDYDDDASNVR